MKHSTYMLTKDGDIYACGYSRDLHILGKNMSIPSLLNNKNITNICASTEHVVVSDINNIYYGNGSTYHNQLNKSVYTGVISDCKFFNK